jgi:hypothetical protein
MGDRGLRRCRPPPGVRVSYMRKQLSRVLFGGKPVNVGGTRDFASTLRCGVFVDDLVIGESGSKEFAHRVGLTAAHDRSIRGSGRRTARCGWSAAPRVGYVLEARPTATAAPHAAVSTAEELVNIAKAQEAIGNEVETGGETIEDVAS